ncbi:MAG: SIS domain-containing protein [Sedimentisphaeraceae bacterium JB056]
MKNTIAEMTADHIDAISYFKANSIETVEKIATLTTSVFKNGGSVYLCGNGGSAADCQHIAGELIGRFRKERKALPAVALTTDTSVLTCLGNDYNFGHIFIRQVEAMVTEKDIIWAFSTSGTSENIIKAVELAKEKRAKIVSFTGKPDSLLETLSDVCLCTNTRFTSSSQEVHQLAYHIICKLIEDQF